ncbi:MAG: hypothetical protein AAGJ29_02855 [Pseudomonadota bacterium]
MDTALNLLEIDVPAEDRIAYDNAVESGSIAALKAVLLSICKPEDRALVETLLPAQLLLSDDTAD